MKKIAYLTNVTADMVIMKLRNKYDVYTPDGFDTWVSEVYNDKSPIYGKDIDAIFVILDGREFYCSSEDKVSAKIFLWFKAVDKLVQKSSSYVFVSTVDIYESKIKSYADRAYSLHWKEYWYHAMQNKAVSSNMYVIDLDARITDIGRNNFYSSKMWYMGSMPYSKVGINTIVDEIDLAMKAAFELRRKIAVVDLDNTLWGGVIGEDGKDGIVLSEHNEGAVYYDFQKLLIEMKKQGVVLGINSKNNDEDVEEVFKHPSMLLKPDDFVSIKINWNNKASNIIEMEKELNLTESAFAFIDDNPVEREVVKGGCPEVEVLDFPSDTVDLPEFIERAYREYFQVLKTTAEDMTKTQMYHAERKRKDVEASSLDMDSYISALEIKVDIHKMKLDELERVHQLVNKTNQFNLTTKRYSLGEIKDIKGDIFTIHTSDKFGDNGLVSVVIVKKENDTAVIDTFIMSCRVMGRKLENTIMGCLVDYYKNDFKKITASYIRTAKNKPVEELYENLGFELLSNDEERKTYKLNLRVENEDTNPYKSLLFNGQEIR